MSDTDDSSSATTSICVQDGFKSYCQCDSILIIDKEWRVLKKQKQKQIFSMVTSLMRTFEPLFYF